MEVTYAEGNYTVRSFITVTLHQIWLELSNEEGWHRWGLHHMKEMRNACKILVEKR
jgi:hypothetical protein